MLEKLPYRVAHLSGQDEDLTGKELEDQTPIAKGWQSARFCLYPQEIVFVLPNVSRIRMIQVLSHQYLIASKIELFIGCSPDDQSTSLMQASFKRLGYFCLKDNSDTSYNVRELKSVHIDAEGNFVKLLVHKNHVNAQNLYNQVCVIAIGILGFELDDAKQELFTKADADDVVHDYLANKDQLKEDAVLLGRINRPDYISPLHDLAFDMCQDPETAQLIRRLDGKKVKAVQEERYDYAKKLKLAIADLKVIGAKLGKWEVEKRRAVEQEDYDLAKVKKLHSDEYRLYVYKQLDLFDLLEIDKEKPTISKSVKDETKPSYSHKKLKPDKARRKQLFPLTTPVKIHHDHREIDCSSKPVTDADERHLPAIAKDVALMHTCRPLPDIVDKGNEVEAVDTPLQPVCELTEKEEDEALSIIETFGMHVAKCVYSKSWQHRHTAADSVIEELSGEKTDGMLSEVNPNLAIDGILAVVVKLFKDQVFAIFRQSIVLAKMLMTSYIPKSKLGKGMMANTLEKVVPLLLHRTGDTSSRIREALIIVICDLAESKDVKASCVLPSLLTASFQSKGQVPWRLYKSRLNILRKLLEPMGINTPEGFQMDKVMKVILKALDHSNKEVRDAAMECLLAVYSQRGKEIKKYLPQDEPASRRNPLFSKIFDAFDRADGVPTEAERKAIDQKVKQDQEVAKKKELISLQSQLHALRSIAAQSVDVELIESGTHQKGDKGRSKAQTKMGESQFIERTCMFCGDQSEDYKTELALDAHYWRSCPMLKRCLLCNQVIEISNIHTHLLTECEKSDSFMKCQHCHQAIESATYKKHVKSKSCQVSAQTKPNCCPLCQNKVQNGDAAWKSHLVGECKANAKRLQLQQGQGTPIDDNQEKPDAVLKSHKSKGPASHQMHAASHV